MFLLLPSVWPTDRHHLDWEAASSSAVASTSPLTHHSAGDLQLRTLCLDCFKPLQKLVTDVRLRFVSEDATACSKDETHQAPPCLSLQEMSLVVGCRNNQWEGKKASREEAAVMVEGTEEDEVGEQS